MGGFALAVIIIFMVQFFVSRNQKRDKIAREGGMRNKYQQLIILILSEHPNTRIFDEGPDYITIRASSGSGFVDFELLQNANYLSVKWITVSNVFGKHTLKWEFPEYNNQNNMMERIKNDTSIYLKNVYNAYH